MIHQLVTPRYKHIINPKLKYIHLTINEFGELIVKSPKTSTYAIEQLLHKKRVWIKEAKAKHHAKKGKVPNFKKRDEEVYFLGKPYPINLSIIQKSSYYTFDTHHGLHLYAKEENQTTFLKLVDDFYKVEAKKLIPNLVTHQAQQMSLKPTAITFRRTKRQWGSCSTKNRLSFNTHTLKLPLDVIQYIIIHELSHIRHKHHQKAFWQEVEKYCPNYRELEQQLKEYLP
ncbi:MAG: M48 family metallopeptidase [Epsilonproteobacteria bacterium]|nr:M48 family metallopeptidase [Campylobacterota bacterium]